MNFNRLSSTRLGVNPATRGLRPVYSNQKRFAATQAGNKGGASRFLLVAIALGVPVSFYLSQRGTPKTTTDARRTNMSTHDEPRAMGPPGGPTSISAKQQGLSNTDTMNPYVNEPGKSKKGEGETDTAKLKGTVKVDRPQA